jgi:hypothetical protein
MKRIPVTTNADLPSEGKILLDVILYLHRRFGINARAIRRIGLKLLCVTDIAVEQSSRDSSNGHVHF